MNTPSPTQTEIAKCPLCSASGELLPDWGEHDRKVKHADDHREPWERCPLAGAIVELHWWNRRAPALAPFEKLADLQGIVTQIHRLRTDGFVNHGSYADKELEAIETRLSAVVEEVRGK